MHIVYAELFLYTYIYINFAYWSSIEAIIISTASVCSHIRQKDNSPPFPSCKPPCHPTPVHPELQNVNFLHRSFRSN